MPRIVTASARWWGRELLGVLLLAAAQGCSVPISQGRARVVNLNLHGVHAVGEDEVRAGIATQETSQWPAQRPRFLRWWRWWWVAPSYLDQASANRDRLRIHRLYESRGYYDVQVDGPEVTTLDGRAREPSARTTAEVSVAFRVREGEPVRVADVRLRGCDDPRFSAGWCAELRREIQLRRGLVLNESTLAEDRNRIRDRLVADGWATPLVTQRAMVDPPLHRAWIEYAIDPGASSRSRFGRLRLLLAQGETSVEGDSLPNGLPTGPVRSAIGVQPGQPYSRSTLATAQQSLFDLGAFSSARIEEVPRADGTVDLNVRLATSRLWRVRLGGGFEADNTRNNLHLLAGYEHRNAFGGFRRLRFELRPQLYFPSIFAPDEWDSFSVTLGIGAAVSFEQPELLRHTTGSARVQFDLAPDPINPFVAIRRSTRVSLSLQRRFTSFLTGAVSLRFVDLGFSANDLTGGDLARLERDPIFRQQFFDQRWVDLEVNLNWDRRDDRSRPSRGHLLSASLSGSVRGPFSDYSFLRGQIEARGFFSVGRNFVFAIRGGAGLAVGETYEANGRWYWPVPPEQRFFLGGTQSHRGYPFNRVGPLATLPADGGNGAWQDDPTRVTAIGGTAMWQGSAELRWQPGAFGVVLFAEAGNVAGFDPAPYVSPAGAASGSCVANASTPVLDGAACSRPGTVAPPAPPPVDVGATLGLLVQRLNPVAGLGLRYMTPIGPIRLDVGVRLDDLDCTRAAREIAAQNAAAPSGRPFFYVTSAPRCDFFGFTAPAAIHLSIGEAY